MQLSSDVLARFPVAHPVSAEKPSRVNYLGVADIQPKPCRQPHKHTVLAQPGEMYNTKHTHTERKEFTAY